MIGRKLNTKLANTNPIEEHFCVDWRSVTVDVKKKDLSPRVVKYLVLKN